MSEWMNFGDAEEQTDFGEIIPHRTPVKVALKIRPGKADFDGCPNGLATRSDESGAVYLDCQYTVIGGKYDKKSIFSMIGLYSAKGPKWGQMGRAQVRAILESAAGVAAEDKSDKAMNARQIKSYADLSGLQFCALVEVDKADEDSKYDDKNKIQTIIGVGHKDYKALMAGGGTTATTSAASSDVGKASNSDDMPEWAKSA